MSDLWGEIELSGKMVALSFIQLKYEKVAVAFTDRQFFNAFRALIGVTQNGQFEVNSQATKKKLG